MQIISKITDVSPWSDDLKVPKEDYKFCTMQQRKTVSLLACDYFVKKWNRDIPVKEFCLKEEKNWRTCKLGQTNNLFDCSGRSMHHINDGITNKAIMEFRFIPSAWMEFLQSPSVWDFHLLVLCFLLSVSSLSPDSDSQQKEKHCCWIW